MRKRKYHVWKIGGAVIGVLLLGGFGYVFGRYGFPALDISRAFPDLRDRDASAGLFAWLLGFVGIPVGASAGANFAERYEGRKRRREWLARHPEQAAAIAEQTREHREEERERRARRRARRKMR